MDKEIRILILEDSPADTELMERELRKSNLVFVSRRVETREDFLRQLNDFTPDLIFADYRLPRFDGVTALQLAQDVIPAECYSGVCPNPQGHEQSNRTSTQWTRHDQKQQ